MAAKNNPYGEHSLGSNLLPNLYRTPANKKFLQSTIDQLFNPGAIAKTSGYIGRQNAKAATGNDLFVTSVDASRQNYQLEPGLVIKDTLGNVTFFKDYIDYINQVGVLGGNTSKHQRLNDQECYSWNPHIDWDKFVNFQNYFWMPFGPNLITINGQEVGVKSTYTVKLVVDGSVNNYLITPDGLTHNPVLTLYRGHTYTFDVTSPGNPFSIKTERKIGNVSRFAGASAAAVESGSITITLDETTPNVLFYQSETDINIGGVIDVQDIVETTFLNVGKDILGKKEYVLPGNVPLSNGMLVAFSGNVTPAEYESGSFYVEGVGSAIKLIPTKSLEIIGPYTTDETLLFDKVPFDSGPFDGALGYASQSDYITINRASRDRNPWSRYNRWVHKDVIVASATYNGNIPSLDQNARAIRPIIEFEADLRLFNFGTVARTDVDLIDDFTSDIFSIIEGSAGYNIDGVDLLDGYRILFTADTDPLVRNKIYQVQFLTIDGARQIHLVETSNPQLDDVVLIKSGVKNQSQMYWYNGSVWKLGQQKINTNQAPLFDVVDENGVSFGDFSVYNGSTFKGTSLFTYKLGTGNSDTTLGFPLTYKNVSNIGDIVFNFTLATDTFEYKQTDAVITKSIDSGYLINHDYVGNIFYSNGWKTTTTKTIQAAVRIYNDEKVNNFNIDIFDDINDLADLEVRVYVNGIRLQSSKWTLVNTGVYKTVVLNDDINQKDILTIRAFASQPINDKGYYEIPINLQNNPLNSTIQDFTLGEVIDHVNSILDNTPSFVGTYPGAGNLRDLGDVTGHGTKFVQHSGPLGLAMYHLTTNEYNIVTAIERSRDDYANFKRIFVAVAETLGMDAAPDVMVEKILQKINANKPKTAPYYFSDMVPYGAKIVTNLTVFDARTEMYPLSSVFTLGNLSNKAVGVYLNGVQLVYGVDYTFTQDGAVKITAAKSVGDIITTYEYDSTDGSFIPSTPTKLGLWPKFVPQKYLDTTLVTPREVIQGHDGSIVLAYGDYRDDLLLELEKRIFNNIKVEYDPTVFDILNVIPGYNRQSEYSLKEFNEVLASSFYKWTGLVGLDFTKQLSYDRSNPFTYNYSQNYTPDGNTVPGYWRGVYRWILDTDRPNICPWEMLGFSIKPAWWETVYGPAPWTGDNLLMWEDLANGIIREPGVPVLKVEKYARPLLMNHIPVDGQGNLVAPTFAGLVEGPLNQNPDNSYVFGDVGPVESAWRRSSFYPFSVLIASLLLTPAKTFGLALDRSRVVRNLAGQLVYSETNMRVKPADILLPSIYSSETRVQTAGIVNYVVDYILNYILSNNVVTYNKYINDLKSLMPHLSYRVGAFTNKDKFNLLLESKTPASSGNVFIPAENYQIFLNESSSLKKLTYSGIVVTKLTSGYEVKGYSRTAPYFKYYPYRTSAGTLNVGGISASYTEWTTGSSYAAGTIVKYGTSFYNVTTTHVATVFSDKFYSKLPALPITGGANVQMRASWDTSTEITVPYGTTFATIQDVYDFIIGYGEWLKVQGFVFQSYNTNVGAVSNWETSAKEFLFWTTQNWSSGEDKWGDWEPNKAYPYGSIVKYNGEFYSALYNNPPEAEFDSQKYTRLDGLSTVGSSVISLSPAALGLTFKTDMSVVDFITDSYHDYEIFKVDGTPIQPSDLTSYREDNVVTYTPRNDGIYGASFYLIQNEHVVIIDNTTIFNDTIYNPPSGYRQERMKVSGYVTVDWYGGLDIPGFVYDRAEVNEWQAWKDYTTGDVVKHQGFYYSANAFVPGSARFDATPWTRMTSGPTPRIIPNWTNLASQFNDFYSLESDGFDFGQQTVAQHLIGYQKRQYLENIIQDDVSEFKFFQGMIREKGTQNVLNKLFKPLGADNTDSLVFYEEWAIRSGQYGATSSFENIEFVLDEGKFRTNPQGILLTDSVDETLGIFAIQLTPNEVYLKPAGYDSKPFAEIYDYSSLLRTAGYVNPADVFLSIGYMSDIVNQDIATFENGSYIWVTFDNPPKYWNVYKFVNTDLEVTSVSYASNLLSVTLASAPTFAAGDYIGITGVSLLAGFHKVASVNGNVFTIAKTISSFPNPFTESSSIVISTFLSMRLDSIDQMDTVDTTRTGELIWTDDDGTGKWAVWSFKSPYNRKALLNVGTEASTQYDSVLAINAKSTLSAIATQNGEIMTREKIGVSVPWLVKQLVQIPFLAHNEIGHDPNLEPTNRKSPTAIAFSPDGTWMASGLPLASHLAWQEGTYYNSINIDAYPDTLSMDQGCVSLYKKDVNNVYTLVDTIVSNYIGTTFLAGGEKFGEGVALTDSTLFVGAPGANKVYALNHGPLRSVTRSFDPVGWSNAIIVLDTTEGIEPGMFVYGTGFDGAQFVDQVLDSKRVLLSDSPSSRPSDTLEFVLIGWKFGGTAGGNFEISGSNNFGKVVTVSGDQQHVMVQDDSNIYVYTYNTVDGFSTTPIGTFANVVHGSISNNGSFVAVCDNTDVTIYSYSNGEYTEYQTLGSRRTGNFGTKVEFMNDHSTIVVYSKQTGTNYIDVYDLYGARWVFSQNVATTTSVGNEFGFVVGNDQFLVTDTDGTVDTALLYHHYKQAGKYTWTRKYVQSAIPDINKVRRAFLYNKERGELIRYLDLVDPAQGKIAGPADAELKFKTFFDPATYSNGDPTVVNVDDTGYWSKDQVGTLWWDLRTAKFVSSYFNDVLYRTNVWNNLAAGASIDVYEWVESSILPASWDAQADTPAGMALGISGTSLYGNASYSVRQRYDNISKTFKNTYYFWVKNKNVIPNVPGRNITALSVANLISNPRGQGYSYLALTGTNSVSLTNIEQYLNDTEVVLSIEYWLTDKRDQNTHSQWKLISNDTIVNIPQNIEQKWFDSLCGSDDQGRSVPDMNQPPKMRYGIENRPRQSMFVNRVEALKQFIERVNRVLKTRQIAENYDITPLESYDTMPSTITGLYDIVLDTDADLAYANASSFRAPTLQPVVSANGAVTGVDIIYAGRGYINPPEIIVHGTGVNAKLRATINASGQITGATVVDGGEGYVQETTVVSVRNYSALVKSDTQTGGIWSVYAYEPSTATWSRTLTQSYDVRKTWTYVDWFAPGYTQFSAPDYAVSTFAELPTLDADIGELVKVVTTNTGNWMFLEKYANSTSVDWTLAYKVVGIQNGTIQLNTSLYNYAGSAIGYDASTYDGEVYDVVPTIELRTILKTLRDNIFIGDLKQEYLDLFLSSVRYAHSEQVYLDWAFKTSFVRATHIVGELGQPVTYPVDNLKNFEDYIAEVKPYRTQIREYISNYNKLDASQAAVTDFDLPSVFDNGTINIIEGYVNNGQVEVFSPEINSYPWKFWMDNVGFVVTELRLVDGGSGYTSPPTITISGGSGSGATAKAFISNGKVTRIVLLTSGEKYITAPSVTFEGGNGTGVNARAVAIIGDGVVRSNLISMKFDRVTQSYYMVDLEHIETISSSLVTGARRQFPLVWGPDIKVGQSSVTINGTPLLREKYKLNVIKSVVAGSTRFSGSITFDEAPSRGDVIVVSYVKDISLLNAADRVQYYYTPGKNQIGKDISQLMTGIDYGGVQVSGLGFELSGGWDIRPYGTEAWDVYDKTFTDYIEVLGPRKVTNRNKFTLTYIPEADTELNVYYVKNYSVDQISDGQSKKYSYDPLLNMPSVVVTTVATTTAVSATGTQLVTIADTSRVRVGDSISTSASNIFASNTKVKTIVSDTVIELDQIIFANLASNTEVSFARTLAQPFDVVAITVGTVSLTTPIPAGDVITISGTYDPVRLDDPNYSTPAQTNTSAVMPTIIADGATDTFEIPSTFTLNDGDSVIIRKSTSDGSIKPQDSDYDTAITGGDFSHESATGLLPEDIVIDGDGLVTPTSSPAPEEVVPGQVVDAVAIKVFDRPVTGSAKVKVDNFIADGVTKTFKVSQIPNSPEAIIVKVGDTYATKNVDYTFDYGQLLVDLTETPDAGVIVTIFSIGFSGQNVLDIGYFISDGIITEFVTRAPYIETVNSLVYAGGEAVAAELFSTDGTYDVPNMIGIRLTAAPAAGELISFIIVNSSTQTYSVTKSETIVADGSLTYQLQNVIGNSIMNESNMIVRVDQNILTGPTSSFFTISGNKYTYTIDPNRVLPNDTQISEIIVTANGNLLTLGIDYTVNLSGLSIKINKKTYSTYKGTELAISVTNKAQYSYNKATGQITFKQAYTSANEIEVISSFVHDTLAIKRTNINVVASISFSPDVPEYYDYKSIFGGMIKLDRQVSDESDVWVTKNNKLLTPSIDYILRNDRQSVLFTEYLVDSDTVTIITFGKSKATGNIAYMQFKDMLNRVHYKRLNANKQTQLARNLHYYDTTIVVKDASNFGTPDPLTNKPGIIEIRGERIEYFTINGNELGQLRRGTLGTGVPTIHEAGTYVQDIGINETLPYTDGLTIDQVISDGTTSFDINFMPGGFDTTWKQSGKTVKEAITAARASKLAENAVEVFVGGYNDITYWASNTAFPVGKIVRVGTYTYKCTVAHTSSSQFVDDYLTNNYWSFFVGNIRLRKSPYEDNNPIMYHDINLAPYSPAGDITMDADFAATNDSQNITLTTAPSVGTQITVIKRTGTAWDSEINILEDDSKVARFIKAVPGSWYTDAKRTPAANVTFDSTIITTDSTQYRVDKD